MKLKAMLLVACATAGVGASIALADNGKGNDQGNGEGCRAEHISGTVGPQTFTITTKTGTVAVTIGGTGQTVRAIVGGCSGAKGATTTSSTLTVRAVYLQAFSTTTRPHDEGGDEHHHTTTTATTTTTHS